jgi:hypothetical protein
MSMPAAVLAPSAPSPLLARLREDNTAVLSSHGARTITPDGPKLALLKSASVMVVSMVTECPFPQNVNFTKAELACNMKVKISTIPVYQGNDSVYLNASNDDDRVFNIQSSLAQKLEFRARFELLDGQGAHVDCQKCQCPVGLQHEISTSE